MNPRRDGYPGTPTIARRIIRDIATVTGTLAVRVGGGHTRYHVQAADKAQAWIAAHEAKQAARVVLGEKPVVALCMAIQESTGIERYEDITEIVDILESRGVFA